MFLKIVQNLLEVINYFNLGILMKTTSLLALALGLLLTFSTTQLLAEEASDHPDGPCIKILEACKAAGYNKSLNTQKSLSKQCLQPLINGQKVEGVNINSSDLEACRSKKAELKNKK